MVRRVISATEARIRFGELIRRVVEEREHVVVERGGKPYVVVLSVEEYERLKAASTKQSWKETLEQIVQLATRINNRRKGKPLTPPEELIGKLREERDGQLSNMR